MIAVWIVGGIALYAYRHRFVAWLNGRPLDPVDAFARFREELGRACGERTVR